MRFNTLDEWLVWQTTLHGSAVDLGLERVGEVARRLELLKPPHRVITIAGTNGKGSCAAMLQAILSRAGFRVGTYTSPHLLKYNERIAVCERLVSDDSLCQAFSLIDEARGEISLSYFEFATLAALHIFHHAKLDVAVLEVGLGGRLDAVNLQDADVGIITSIGLDHTDWLGPDKESIGREKAGILRAGRPAVYGDPDPPKTILARAEELGAELFVYGQDYRYVRGCDNRWTFVGASTSFDSLPFPALQGENQFRNASAVLMALEILGKDLPCGQQAIEAGLSNVSLTGRFQRLWDGDIELILDVAHNPDGAEVLAGNLRALEKKRTHCVFTALDDKDVFNIAKPFSDFMSSWHIAESRSARSFSVEQLRTRLEAVINSDQLHCHLSVASAYESARLTARPGERIVVFGSFFTVAEVLALRV